MKEVKLKLNKNKEIGLKEFQDNCNHKEWKSYPTTYGDRICSHCNKLLESIRNNYYIK